MIFQRKLTPHLLKEIPTKEIVVVTGMRRTGKTTLLRQVFEHISSENKVFLDLENPLNRKLFEEKNFDNILANLKSLGADPERKMYFFLDEIQLMPEVTQAIKYLYDHYNIKFFLTGSSSYYLKNLFPESLAGRKIVFHLLPLDFEEFLWFHQKKKAFANTFTAKAQNKNVIAHETLIKEYEEYLQYGGFPSVVLEKNYTRKQQLLSDIFTSYFEQDVKGLSDFRSLSRVRDLILLLSKRVGSKIEVSKLASEIGVARETVYSYLSFLEASYFLFLVKPFSRSVDREVSGAKKVYFCDTGLLNMLGKTDEGSLLENAVFRNLLSRGDVNYYERRRGGEIDFVLDGTTGIEVKMNACNSDLIKLEKLAGSINLKQAFAVSKNFFNHPQAFPATDL